MLVSAYYAEPDSPLQRLDIQAQSMDEANQSTAHGVYASFRLWPPAAGASMQRALRLESHLARMRSSAELLGLPYPLDDQWIRQQLYDAICESGISEPRVRLTVPHSRSNSLLIFLQPFEPLGPDVYSKGVRVALTTAHRKLARAKDSRFIETRQQLGGGEFETILVDDDGYLLEGTSSNFYAVIEDVLYTAEEGVLEGITRHILLEVAEAILPVARVAVAMADLPLVSEAMLTSSTRGVVPIIAVGAQRIGGGRPGPWTQRLSDAYIARLEFELAPLLAVTGL